MPRWDTMPGGIRCRGGIPCRVGYGAAVGYHAAVGYGAGWDTMPGGIRCRGGIPCRAGYRAGWDSEPGVGHDAGCTGLCVTRSKHACVNRVWQRVANLAQVVLRLRHGTGHCFRRLRHSSSAAAAASERAVRDRVRTVYAAMVPPTSPTVSARLCAVSAAMRLRCAHCRVSRVTARWRNRTVRNPQDSQRTLESFASSSRRASCSIAADARKADY